MLRIGALSVPLSAFSSVHRGVLQRRLSFGTLAIAEVAGALTGSCTAVAMAFSGWGVWSLIAHILIQPAITSIITILAGPRIWSGISGIKSAWPLVVFGLSVIVPRLVDYAGQSFDTWIIGRYFGRSSLGLFTVAYTAALLPMFFMSSVLLQIALSVFSRMQNNMKAMNRTFMKLSEFSALAAGAYFCILFVFTPEITMFLDSRRMSAPVWGPSVQFIRILIPMGFLYAVSSFYNITWLAMGMMKERMWIVVFNTASLAISVITGAFFSINGICIALSIRALIMYFVVITITMRKTGLDIFAYFGRILSVAAIGAAVVVAALWLRNTAAGMAGVRLSLYMPAGILIVLALYFTAVRLILPGIFKESLTLIGKFISFGRKTGF
jgi:O-antigen/teichoic acid export membrane protein